MKKIILALCLTLPFLAHAQIQGIVNDQNGDPLPYVSIYVKGSSQGTTTNIEGQYKLNLSEGNYEIVYQYVGLETISRQVKLGTSPEQLDITMNTQPTLISEVTIAADAEDPAYRVIRNAQRKRKYYRDLIKQFQCDVYVKGNQKILNAPEKILGQEIGDLDGNLDSNRQGIVYLSESISKLYFKKPYDLKEIVYSSKVSGDDNGYSFNTAREMEFNVYDNTMDFSRELVSPISDNAMAYYRYRLLGTFYDNDGRLINKIQLLPKRESDPVFYGTVYIVEDLWSVHSLDVGVTSKASQLYFLDSVEVSQVFVPIAEPDVWRIFSNNISFKMGIFGFQMKGYFSATYSNYDLTSEIDDNIFNSEVFIVEKDSNKKDSLYWEEKRPTPLTLEEKVDYIRKDSIQEVRDDPAYKDSIDHKGNQFNLGNVLGGYRHNRSSKHTYWEVDSPLSHVSFNTVQGFNTSLDMSWWKYFDEEETNRIIIDGKVDYGFSEKKIRANGRVTYRPNRLDRSHFFITGGSDIKQINKFSPIDELRNNLYSLFAKRNYPKYYDYEFLKVGLGKEVANGIRLNAVFGYENRSPLTNTSDYSFFYKDNRQFTSNSVLNTPIISEHEVFSFELYANIRFNQQYFVYPDRKFDAGNTGPALRLKYRNLTGINNDISLHALSAQISDEVSLGARGAFSYYIEGGSILQSNDLEFIDRFHFRGNQYTLSDPQNYHNSFLALPYYSHSTDGNFIQAHIQHNFNGFIMDKIPVLNELGFSLVVGAKYLYAEGHDSYNEIHLGIDKIGWHIFRILRFDLVRSSLGGDADMSYRIGIKIGSNTF